MDKYKIIWSPKALTDLNRTYEYIFYNLKEPDTARNLYNEIINAVFALGNLPQRNPDLMYYGIYDKHSRRLRVENYIVLYDVDIFNLEVNILHIFHSKQNYLNII